MTNTQGFTLVETLVALTIFSIVGLTAFALLSRALAAHTAVERVTGELRQRQQSLTLLQNDLAGAQSFALAPFQGASDSLCFSRVVKRADGTTALCRIVYRVRPDSLSRGWQLVRTLTDFLGGKKTRLLLTELAGLQFRYWRREKGGGRWVENWPAAGVLPPAVCLQFTRQSGGQSLQLTYPIRTHDRTMAQ
ncbi:MAG: prepilin-type N-terminal cleavage/methylation domain-containing protein [candidate division KSB1 bacterium]|nr:prepilin-type N-terminal cleavage/methylation domain-containing protein [candidate division KSB1 bacterium]MDZ7300440.1 prepilin-type N-terminal cleavage/methylation domain-containing protein [candidate division KSB1 bacterium]MDZ7308719.1 prepilin-type N-terminal cleavage/methylation domain-containing protein [candidate division KSB1 bacterium]MDZ7351458.1 prepilin-type N-terminal cleavage/methylation domain-containing protein [candidate division KSB1 bacterium]MDZ7355817.1 prepilin-type N-